MIVGVTKMKELLFNKHPFDFVVSITEEGVVHPELLSYPHLALSFYDIPWESSFGMVGPSMKHVEQLANLPSVENILFHCTAGYSRSTAASIIHLMHLYGSEQKAYDRTVEIVMQTFKLGHRRHPNIGPNVRMIALADEYFGSKGKLIATVKKTEFEYV